MEPATVAAIEQRWDEMLRLLRGDPQLDVIAGREPAALITPPPLLRIHNEAFVFVCEGFMPPGFADWFIARAQNQLAPALTNIGGERGVADPMRTNLVFEINAARYDAITALMAHRYAAAVRVPVNRHEPPNVLSYQPGQKFDYHTDFVDPSIFPAEIAQYGQRVTTAVTYLNEDFEDGETHFPHLNIKLRARPGDAIIFSNVLAHGQPDQRTVHAGLPPSAGRKWALSQWARSKPLNWLTSSLQQGG